MSHSHIHRGARSSTLFAGTALVTTALVTTLAATLLASQAMAQAAGEPLASAAVGGAPANAGDSAPEPVTSPADIVVTARKREERLQDVPAAIFAFTGDQLRQRGIRDITDLSLQTPGFAMQNASRQNEQPFIRGMSANSVFRQAQTASFFVDGIYVSGVGRTVSVDDVERIEVVLGPQAVHFGRATFAGAVNYITRKPQLGAANFDMRVNLGENGLADVTAGFNVPLGEMFALRAFGQFHTYDGEYRNSVDGRKVGSERTMGGSVSLRFQPAPNFDMVARFMTTEFDDGHSPTTIFNPRVNNNCRPNAAGVPQFFCGQLRNPVESDIALNLSALDGGGYRRVQQKRYSLLANWDINDFTISSVTGYNEETQQLSSDGDATRFAPQGGLLHSLFDSEFTDTYQELRLVTPADRPVRVLVGGSYFDSTRIDSSLLKPIVSLSNPRDIRNHSIFGSVAWTILPEITATAEGRYQVDRIKVRNTTLDGEFKSFLPRFVVDFRPGSDILGYVSVGKGNKPGDFNTASGTPIENQIVQEETIWNYEAGIKTQWLDRRLTANLTAYHIDWSNQGYQDTVLQRDANNNLILAPNGQPRTVVVTRNIGQTRINGFELDTGLIILPGWNVRAAYSYTDAKFVDFLSRLPITYSGAPAQVAGNTLFNSPKHKLILSSDLRLPISNRFDLFASTDLTLRGKQYTDELNTAYVGTLTLWNARLGVSTDSLEFFVWGRNLTDSKIPDFATRSLDFNSGINSYLFTLRPGRSFGLTMSARIR